MLSRRAILGTGLSFAALGAVGYSVWPRMGAYEEEIARQRQLLGSDPQLADLLRMATLAANGHNTQPWRFRVGEDTVSMLPDFSRRTAVVDPDDHHLYVSLGCAAENLLMASRSSGRPAELAVRAGTETELAFAFSAGTPEIDPLLQAIPFRQSTRSKYDGNAVSNEDIRLLTEAARVDGVSVAIFTEPADRDAILDFVIEGNSAQMDDPAFVAELRDWIRFTPSHALETNDGLFAATSGNPVVPRLMAERLFNMFFRKDAENDKYRDHVRSSAGIAVFAGDQSDPEHWIKVGRSFQRFALQGTLLGIRNAHLNQPIEAAHIRPEFARWLGAPDVRPDLIIRFGRAPALPMSLRRPVGELFV